MSWRLFMATTAASLFLTSCGDSEKVEKKTEPIQDDMTRIEVQEEIEDDITQLEEKIAEVGAEVKEKEAETLAEIEKKKEALEAEIKEKEAELKVKTEEINENAEETVVDYSAMIDKYLKMDMATVKSDLANLDETTLSGLGSKIMVTINAESAKITKFSHSLKSLSIGSISDAPALKKHIAELKDSKENLTELYDEVMAQLKSLTSK